MPGFEQGGAPEQPVNPEASGYRSPQDFATRMVNGIQRFFGGNGVTPESLGGMRGRPGGDLQRFVGWLQDGGFNRGRNRGRSFNRGGNQPQQGAPEAQRSREMIAPEELMNRVMAVTQKFPSVEFTKFAMDNPDTLVQWLIRRSITPGAQLEWIAKLEKTADRMIRETPTRAGWENPDSWMQGVQFDGLRFWAVNRANGETCIATAGQLLFAKGAPEQIRAALRGPTPSVIVHSLSGKQVQWDVTEMGQRFTTDGGTRKIYSRDNDGDTVEIMNGGRTQSVTHFGNTIVTRVNGRGAGVAQSTSLDDNRLSNALPEGTFVRAPNGEWLGNSAREVQKRGMQGYIAMLSQLPVREMAAYISSIFNDQHEEIYSVRNSTQAFAFRRDYLGFEQSIRSGGGDCREVAKLCELALRRKGVRCVTIKLGGDHAGLAMIFPSGDPRRPYVCHTIENTGYHDEYEPGRTPGEALMNAREDNYRARYATILNDKMRAADASYEAVAAKIINMQMPQ